MAASAPDQPELETADSVEAATARLRAAVAAVAGPEHAGADPMVKRSDRADLQANLAMALGKKVGRPPKALAEALAAELDAQRAADPAHPLAAVEVAGPGFLNLTLADGWLAAAADRLLLGLRGAETDGAALPAALRAARPERVVVDYSSPNVAKEMHVGHLRSTVIGDALCRVLEARGHTVLRQNHVGDWGTPFGMLIEHLVDTGEQEAERELGTGELTLFYKAARAKFDADAAFAERARRRVVSLQAGDAETRRLWERLVQLSARYFAEVYGKLGATLRPEHTAGESFYNARLAPLTAELLALGAARPELVRVDDGAVCAFPPGFKGKDGAPLPLIVQKSDGGYGYATTDLAGVRYRLSAPPAGLGARRVLYVVGAPQAQHLSMVFATAREAGWVPEGARLQHVAFGSVLGTDRRMFKTRSGDAVRLVDLIDEAIARAEAVVAEKAPHLEPAERAWVGRAVGVGAIKYADLSSDRIKDYQFDLDRMLAFEGNTGPYLQYAHARLCSLLRKAAPMPPDAAHAEVESAPSAQGRRAEGSATVVLSEGEEGRAERALVLQLSAFGAAVAAVDETLEPHRLCTYLYDLATAFTAFYERCPVLKAEGATRAARLALCELTRRTLGAGLGLLGVDAPERM